MATDYDASRRPDDDSEGDGLGELKVQRIASSVGPADLDEGDQGPIELPGADLSSEELVVKVVPPQSDEFTCTSCFLVQHRARLGRYKRRKPICQDCL